MSDESDVSSQETSEASDTRAASGEARSPHGEAPAPPGEAPPPHGEAQAPPGERRPSRDAGTDDGVGGGFWPTVGQRPAVSGPTRGSTALVVLLSTGLGALLAAEAGSATSVPLALVAALAFAASLWLVDRDRWRLPALALAGALTLVVGFGLAVAVGYTALDLVSDLYPVTEMSQVQPRGVRVVGTTMVAAGATAAIVGGVTAVGSVLRAETARAHAALAVKTCVVPLSAGALLLLSTLLSRGDPALLTVFLDPVVAVADAVLSPAPGRLHLFTFSLLLLATAAAVYYALDALPVTELTTGRRRERAAAAVATARTWTLRAGIAAAALLALALVEFTRPPSTLASVLPDPLTALLAAVTGAHVLRWLAVALLAASLCLLVVVRLLRRSVQTGVRDVALALTPFVGGGAIVALVVLTHGHVLDPALAAVTERLPGAFGTAFDRQTSAFVDLYGSAAVTMVLAALLVGVDALASLALAASTTLDADLDRTIAPALASTGLFVAAAFAAGVGVGPLLVLAGIVGSLVVWDTGEYGVTLGREVGRGAHARSPELVHLGGTLAVGVVGALAARSLVDVATGTTVQSVATLPFAFVVVLVGLVLLVTALR